MNKELEESILLLRERSNEIERHIISYEKSNCETSFSIHLRKEKNAIETVVQALENYQIKELQFLNNNLDNISATELQTILQPYYMQKENLEHKDKIINKLKNELENSISKEAIKEKIEEYKQQLKNKTKRVVQLQVLEQNGGLQQSEWEELNILFGDVEKIRGKLEILQELLEGK